VVVGLAAQGQAQALAAVALLPELLGTVDVVQQHQILGELLYPLVAALVPEAAGKVTGMFLELDQSTVLRLIGDPVALAASVQEAVVAIDADLAAARAGAAALEVPPGAPREAAAVGPELVVRAAPLPELGVGSGSGGLESDADSGLPVETLESVCAALQRKVTALQQEVTTRSAAASRAASAAEALLSTSKLRVATLERQLAAEKALVVTIRGKHTSAMAEQVRASAEAQNEQRSLLVRKFEAAERDRAQEFSHLAASEAAARQAADRSQHDVHRLLADGAALRSQVITHEELLAQFLESGTGAAPASGAVRTPPVAAAVLQPGVEGVAAVGRGGVRRPAVIAAPPVMEPTPAGAAPGVAVKLPVCNAGRQSADATASAAPVGVAPGSRFSVLSDDDPGDGVGCEEAAGMKAAAARVVAPATGRQVVLDRANVTDLAGTPAWSGSHVWFGEPRRLPTPRVVALRQESLQLQSQPQKQQRPQLQQRPQQQQQQRQRQRQRPPLSLTAQRGVLPGDVLPQRPSGWRETSRVFHSFKQRWHNARERGLLGADLEAAVGMTERELQRLGRIVRDADPRHALRSPQSAPSRRTLATVESVLGRTGLVAADGGRAG